MKNWLPLLLLLGVILALAAGCEDDPRDKNPSPDAGAAGSGASD